MKRGNKKAQVSIFIIIAVIIVAVALLVFLFYPKIQSTEGFDEKNPQEFIRNCIEDEIQQSVEKLSLQGGSLNPEHFILYENNKIEYLCYTGEYYKFCVMQQPLLKQHIESEIKNKIKANADICFDSLKDSYLKKGYSADLKKGDTIVELLPNKIKTTFNHILTLKKADTQRYDLFDVILNNNLYERVSITDSILNWESVYGSAETTIYMNTYHDLKVEKKEQTDGTTIYILTDRNNGDKFQFASRSLVIPPGYL